MNRSGKTMTLDELLAEKPRKFCSGKKLFSIAVIVLLVSACVGTVCYFALRDNSEAQTCPLINDSERIDCYPEIPVQQVTRQQCIDRGCCYNFPTGEITEQTKYKVPYCYYPLNYENYKIDDVKKEDNSYTVLLSKVKASGFKNDSEKLLLVISQINENSIRIKITDRDSSRFEVPIVLDPKIGSITTAIYNINVTLDGTLTISRKSNELVVFKTSLSRLVYSEQFLQLSTLVTSPYVYGLGEHMDSFLRSVNWNRLTLFNQGDLPEEGRNLYGTHPFYIALEDDGKANGAFLYNSNAMDVLLQPAPAVTFRPIGGVLDLFILLGPTPSDVVQQYTNIVGRTFMPPYWSLGFQLCRYGYNSTENTKAVFQKTRDAGIPYDVQWNDIDYMDRNLDFTYSKTDFGDLPEFVKELHKTGMYYVAMISPGLSSLEKNGTYPPFDDAVAKDLFVKNATGQYFEGKVWNNATVFIDFSNPATESYWKDQFAQFLSQIDADGIWIDMNEPTSFYNGTIDGCPESSYEDPPYNPGFKFPLRTMTVCMTAKHHSTTHYNEHNLHAFREAEATNLALRQIKPNKRPFIISRASFIGQGQYSGHWSGDIASSWEHMRYTIPFMFNFNIYGMSMVGSDICGFRLSTTEELCTRWQSLGAFYPFSRNHNDFDTIEQDPATLGGNVLEATKKSLNTRYYLLPYFYTLFYKSHAFGDTVIRPLFFEYPTDNKTYGIDETFLWGPALLIVPVLYPKVTEVTAYFPKGLWYDFDSGENITSSGEEFKLSIPLTDIGVKVRSGYILPLQQVAVTTTESRKNAFDLLVALDDNRIASGDLFWDDGETLDTIESGIYNHIYFNANSNSLNSTVLRKAYDNIMNLGNIKIYGVDIKPTEVKINTKDVTFEFNKNVLIVHGNETTNLAELLEVTWN